MLRVIVNASSAGAKSYYSQGLSKEDYYAKENSQEIIGLWHGKGATLLGLNGKVDKEQFASLCDNINPETGEQLTARNIENRRVGYDLNFHAPKSVSICYSLNQDENIMSAFRDSVQETMTELEKNMQARVRVNGQNDNRDTGNLIYGEFIHTTARPVDGIPDPHLHAHCFTFNATYDQVEDKWKAGEFATIKRDAAFFEAYFHSAFSSKLKEAGYGIERTEKGWEIAGINRDTIEKFSNRTQEVETIAAEKGITDAKVKDGLGAKTRSSKIENLTLDELRTEWSGRLTEREKAVIGEVGKKGFEKSQVPDMEAQADKAVNMALEHCLERKSVAGEREVLRDAMRRSYGDCTPAEVIKAYGLKEKEMFTVATKDGTVLTTKEAVKEERQLVEMTVSDKGKLAPINKGYEIQNPALNEEQQKAVKHALASNDRVIVIEGGAGTGKTTLMKEINQGCESAGKKVFAFAPSAEASRGVLQSEGFEKADTVARLLQDKELQTQLKNQVLWVDEAGLLGNKQAGQILEIAKSQNARLILTGDTRQHNSVERGDALRIILEKSKIKPARVTEIQRQRNRADYKQVVKQISEGKQAQAFDGLEKMGAIQEIADPKERYAALAKEYAADAKSKKSVLVVAPTHIEGEQVTAHIRAELKKTKLFDGTPLLAEKENTFTIQKNLSPTEAQKQEVAFYRAGQSVQFHQNAKGFMRGSIFDVVGKDEKGNIQIRNGKGEVSVLPLAERKKFSVFEKTEINLSKGDRIRITQNGFSENKKRMNNGNIMTVSGFDSSGNIIARPDQSKAAVIIGKDFRNFTYGYATTSHSSQGKTVDKVLIAQSSFSARAGSKEQFYVSVSRGKGEISIFTDNKQELKEAVGKSSARATASEVAQKAEQQKRAFGKDVLARQSLPAQQKLVSRLATLARVHYERARAITQNVKQVIVRR
ncbi:MAG: relaxase domain-containing protein [Saprospiraceae bacterium]|nr:relaxase domain-containing protein [Saprospiraceae bacterium]